MQYLCILTLILSKVYQSLENINLYQHELPPNSPPKEFIIQLLELVIKYNIFKFGNTWWRQLIGTTMGTPCACAYAMLFFGLIERTEILPKYENRLKLYVRQIDDILILWKLSEDDTNKKKDTDDWNEFKSDLNSATKLNWII